MVLLEASGSSTSSMCIFRACGGVVFLSWCGGVFVVVFFVLVW